MSETGGAVTPGTRVAGANSPLRMARATSVRARLATVACFAAGVGLLAGCRGLEPLPLRPSPIPYADTLPIPEPPTRSEAELLALIRESTVAELSRPLDPDEWSKQKALNLTHFDEVVNSSWYERRITERELTPEEVRRGPTTVGPDTTGPFVVVDTKKEGISPGFTVRDARGVRYLFKFDPPENPYLASAANTISNRLLWAAGYNVPEDFIVVFAEDDLTVEPGGDGPDEDDVKEVLSLTSALPDGRYRAIASKFLPGTPKGPFRFSGVWKKDPNDYYLHQNRRELRGLYVVAAWINHVDLRFQNTLDIFIEPTGYIRHYLIDFGATLGSGTVRPHNPREGTEYNFDIWPFLARIVTLGIYKVGWEGQQYEVIDPSVGWLPVEGFKPGSWKANWPNDAFRAVTASDGYWGAKIVGSFTDEMIRAAVEAGELPTQHATDTLTAILIARRDKTVSYWYEKVTPIERPQIAEVTVSRLDAGSPVPVPATSPCNQGFVLAFEDLGLDPRVRTREETAYEWELHDPGRGRHWRGRGDPGPFDDQGIFIAPEACLGGGDPRDGAPRADDGAIPSAGSAGAVEPSPAADNAGGGDARAAPPLSKDLLATLRIRVLQVPSGKRLGDAVTVYLAWVPALEAYTLAGIEH